MKYRPPLGLLKPLDRSRTVRIDFNVARDSRWLTRSASRPLPPALSRCPLTNLVGEDNQRRRTPAVLRPWTLAGPTDAAGALNRTVHLQDADGCESSLSVEVTPARLPCHRWRRGARAQDLHGPDQARFRGSESSLSTPAAGREALVRMNAV